MQANFFRLEESVLLFAHLVHVYLLVLRYARIRIARYQIPSALFSNGERVLVFQLVLLSLLIIPSSIFEDMTFFARVSWQEWLWFVVLGACLFLLGNWFLILSTQQLGPVVTGSVLPIRLVASIAGSAVLGSDYFRTGYQVMGAVACLMGISAFLIQKLIEPVAAPKTQYHQQFLNPKWNATRLGRHQRFINGIGRCLLLFKM